MPSFANLFAAGAILAGLSAAAPAPPFGFPKPNATQLLQVQAEADGTLSNNPPPPKLANSSLTAFQLIAANEIFESYYFTSLLYNVTNDVPGFELPSQAKKDELITYLTTVLAQEELHAITALSILDHFGAFAPQPCQYTFPTTNLPDALALAVKFTSVVLGTLQDAATLLATNGDDGAVRAIASVIGQEGEQNGFYRIVLARKPSEKPFLTASVAPFAFSALQGFTVPNSCPYNLDEINLPIFTPLNVLTANGGDGVTPNDQNLSFEADLTNVAGASQYLNTNGAGLYLTYLTGQNLPISEPLTNVKWSGSKITFDAFFPFTANVMDGLSIAALTTSSNFTSPDDVPKATLAAPGLIEVNDLVTSVKSRFL